MHQYFDQCGISGQLPGIPAKIISLVPSQSELLYYLGLDTEVAGITKFCIHPSSWYKTKTHIGGTKNVHIKMVQQIQPDLIIGNKEENDQQQVETLARDFPTWISNISDLDAAYSMIKSIGTITGKENVAKKLIENIRMQFALITPPTTELKVAYLIWKNPFMAAGGDTFINNMLTAAGFKNVFAHLSRYPVISIDQIISSGCQFVFLSSEPYPFKEKHIRIINEHIPSSKVFLVDGELFSWYGSRLLKAPAYFNRLRKLIMDNN